MRALGLTMEPNEQPQKVAVEAILASYGRFCVTFELAVFRLRTLLEAVLRIEGLKNQGVVQVLFANQTAEPLRALLYPLIAQIRTLTKEESKAINNILTRFQDLIEQRNVVVHSTWFLMALDQEDVDYEKLNGFKYYRKKGVESLKVLATDKNALDGYTEEANILADCFMALHAAIGFGDPINKALKPNSAGVYLPNFKQYWPET